VSIGGRSRTSTISESDEDERSRDPLDGLDLHALQTLKYGSSLEDLVQMGMVGDNVLKALGPEGRVALAKLAETTVEDIDNQIAAL
jgi:hypothetical protein